MNDRPLFRRAALALGAAALASPALAQGIPDRPIRLVVPYTPGGSTDTVARLVAQRMSEVLQQQVVVENRSGAGGIVGTHEVVRAAPDGTTLAYGNSSTLVLNKFLYRRMPYDPVRDLAPLAHICLVPNLLVVNREVPVTNLQELIAYIKASPGQYGFGSAGNGTSMHLSGVLFQKLSGTEMIHVPYRGSIPAMQDIMAGRLLMMIDNVPGPLALVQGGSLRPIGVSSRDRVPVLPEVPTLAQGGLTEFVNQSWAGLCVHPATPAPIRARLEAATLAAVNHPETQRRLRELGTIPAAMDGAEFGRFWQSELAYWAPIVESTGLVLD